MEGRENESEMSLHRHNSPRRGAREGEREREGGERSSAILHTVDDEQSRLIDIAIHIPTLSPHNLP